MTRVPDQFQIIPFVSLEFSVAPIVSVASPVYAMTSVQQLFGGAITAELPAGLVDASCVVSMRQLGSFD